MPNRSQTFILGITPVQVLNRGKIHYPGITPALTEYFTTTLTPVVFMQM